MFSGKHRKNEESSFSSKTFIYFQVNVLKLWEQGTRDYKRWRYGMGMKTGVLLEKKNEDILHYPLVIPGLSG